MTWEYDRNSGSGMLVGHVHLADRLMPIYARNRNEFMSWRYCPGFVAARL